MQCPQEASHAPVFKSPWPSPPPIVLQALWSFTWVVSDLGEDPHIAHCHLEQQGSTVGNSTAMREDPQGRILKSPVHLAATNTFLSWAMSFRVINSWQGSICNGILGSIGSTDLTFKVNKKALFSFFEELMHQKRRRNSNRARDSPRAGESLTTAPGNVVPRACPTCPNHTLSPMNDTSKSPLPPLCFLDHHGDCKQHASPRCPPTASAPGSPLCPRLEHNAEKSPGRCWEAP